MTSAVNVGLYTCRVCGGLFRVVGEPAWFVKTVEARVKLLESLLDELDVSDPALAVEAGLVAEELARWQKKE